ncbi:glycine--tRNA ligase [Candidatus Woesearchaeota archaeon]|nr:glycine--tRNA ligase [Candidatus Woesearchaeota archaeon]
MNTEEMAAFCKKKGFVYPNSEIYGGMAGFFDYGPLGAELKNNIKAQWWNAHVHQRADIVGIDGAIITSPKTWVASGHASSFTDAIIECAKNHKTRADHLIEDKLKMDTAGLPLKQIDVIIRNNKLKCDKCNSPFKESTGFNLMFKTTVGPEGTAESYLRPETAQLIFADFKNVIDTTRVKLPFGIAQTGKAFRNEISPRDFLFRCREFEQMEIEYFTHPNHANTCPYLHEVETYEFIVLSAEMQEKKLMPKKMTAKEALDKKIMRTQWHAYWLAYEHKWLTSLGISPENLRLRQHLDEEKSHYALDTWDIEYRFPMGWKELQGMANRTDFDLQQHIKHSGKDLSYYDEETKTKVVPHVVVEPSQGVERLFLALMFEAYEYDKERDNVVLKLHPKLAPYKAAVFPLVSNKPELVKKAKEVHTELAEEINCFYDEKGSIGRRYSRQDEIGTPACITIDFQSLDDGTVTIRERDTTHQARVKTDELHREISRIMKNDRSLFTKKKH